MAEAQAAVLARLYSGRLSLPSPTEMEKWETEELERNGTDGRFHDLLFPKDANYLNQLSGWARSAKPRVLEKSENNVEGRKCDRKDGNAQVVVHGKMPPVWGEWECWCRERFPAIRKAFGELGERRKEVTTIEELGFVFESGKTVDGENGRHRSEDDEELERKRSKDL
jgi:hypothetical protein